MEAASNSGLLEIVEISEWLDWMRRELPRGGVELPNENSSVLFVANSLRIADRIRPLCRHLPIAMRSVLIEAAILHQCWSYQQKLWKGFPSARRPGLRTVEGRRYLRQISDEGHHVIEAHDGIQYVVRFASDSRKNTLATEAVCASLARFLHLPGVPTFVVTIDAKLRRNLEATGLDSFEDHRNPGPGLGFRYSNPSAENVGDGGRRSQSGSPLRQSPIGCLIFDILTLNLNLTPSPTTFRSVTGLVDLIFVDRSHCLMNTDWEKFRYTGYAEPIAQSEIARRIHTFSQMESWISCAERLDLHGIWELAFQLPPQWYGGDRMAITRVLDKLAERMWTLRRSVHAFVDRGYFPNIKKAPATVELLLPIPKPNA